MKKTIVLLVLTALSLKGFSQENREENQGSVIQTYTPSKLLKNGQWDIKWFNNLYTETKDLFGAILGFYLSFALMQ